MRQISDAALAKILETQGSDPITLVQIFWTEDNSIIYGDRAFTPQIKGCLLDVGDIENVINNAAGSNSGSVSIRLDDVDGSIKSIMDSMDIHKRPVYILQWFPELPLKDAFILFDGVIHTPITWKEGERTLSFDVLSKIESLEVGYSAEEGNFEYIPPNLIGKAWPLIFGTVLRVPAVQINEIPSGFSNEDTGINAADNIKSPLKNFADNERKNINLLEELERECFVMAAILLGEATTLDIETVRSGANAAVGLSGGGTEVETGGLTTPGISLSGALLRKSDNPVAQQLFDLGTQYEQKGNEYRAERLGFNPNNSNYDPNPEQKNLEKNQLKITNGAKFPQKQNIIITINGAQHEGYFEGDIFTIVERTHPFSDQGAVAGPTEVIDRAVATEFKTDLAAQTFFYAIAGSLVGMGPTDYPVYYIVGIPWVTDIVVLAKKRDGTNNKYVVPANYYSVQYATFNTLQVTLVVMSRPLSTRGEKWEDEIWVNCVSPLGPNAADIIQYLVENYTDESIDTVSFATVKSLINPYKMGFALLDRKNALDVIKEIAYQARCAIWFKGGRFYIKYLPLQSDPVDTIVEADVESGTMEVTGTDTEDLVTKWTVEWAIRLDQTPKNRIVYRYHIKKYGMVEQTYDCFAFNNQKLVEKFALFWLIRKANTWKRLKFSTFLTKLRLEPFDSVLINFSIPWVNDTGCVNPTIGIIEKASYNSDTSRIELEIWLPIRFGEMCPYDFAYPSGLGITEIFPQENDPGIQNDIPGAGATGSLFDQSKHIGVGKPNVTPENSGSGGNKSPGDSADAGDVELNPPVELNPADMINTGNGVSGATSPTTVSQRLIKQFEPALTDLGDGVFPGFVRKQNGDKYDVDVYFNGLNKPSKSISVKQLDIDSTDIVPPNTPTMITRNIQRSDKGLISGVEYTMQVPIWLKPKDASDTSTPNITPQSDAGTQSSEPPLAPPETDEGDE